MARESIDPSWFCDTTEIIIPQESIEGHIPELTEAFMVTIDRREEIIRIIGSPVVITEVRKWLTNRGIPVN